jgi:hypothetical protein
LPDGSSCLDAEQFLDMCQGTGSLLVFLPSHFSRLRQRLDMGPCAMPKCAIRESALRAG